MSASPSEIKKKYEDKIIKHSPAFNIRIHDADDGRNKYEHSIDKNPFLAIVRKTLLANLQTKLPKKTSNSKPVVNELTPNPRRTPPTPAFTPVILLDIVHDSGFQRDLAITLTHTISHSPLLPTFNKLFTGNKGAEIAVQLGNELANTVYINIVTLPRRETKINIKAILYERIPIDTIMATFLQSYSREKDNPPPILNSFATISARHNGSQTFLINLANPNHASTACTSATASSEPSLSNVSGSSNSNVDITKAPTLPSPKKPWYVCC